MGYTFRSLRYFLLIILLAAVCRPLRAQDTVRTGVRAADTAARHLQDTSKAGKAVLAAGTDTTPAHKSTARDTSYIPNSRLPHSPRKAALYSAVLPGLGQAYNREYWKVPLVYAAIGTCTYFFVTNMDTYKRLRNSYRIRMSGNPDLVDNDNLTKNLDNQSVKYNRDLYRQYVDYSVLFFILSYGLNIIDATVFAHLRNFDMSDDLSMRISPTLINNRTLGIGINISLGGKKARGTGYFAGR
jgi:hypothetical protein